MLAVTLLWVVSASVVQGADHGAAAKQARAAQQPSLVAWYSGGMALANGLVALFRFMAQRRRSAAALPSRRRCSGWRSWRCCAGNSPCRRAMRRLPPPPLRQLSTAAGGPVAGGFRPATACVRERGPVGKLAEPARLPWLLPWLAVGRLCRDAASRRALQALRGAAAWRVADCWQRP